MSHERKKVLIAVIIISALVCLAACGYLVFRSFQMRQGAEEYSELQNSFYKQTDATVSADEAEDGLLPESELPVDFVSLMDVNPDLYAWITIPETKVNYPVLQSKENDNFYLDHNVYKNYSFPGAIYSQECNKRDWSDRVTVLYGHNMLDGTMFATLHKFEDKSFFDENPYFYIYTADRKLTYEIVTAFLYDDKHIMNAYDFTKDNVFQDWLDQAKNPRSLGANVRDSVPLNLNSKLVVLSTCPNYDVGRYLVQGVQIKDERIKRS